MGKKVISFSTFLSFLLLFILPGLTPQEVEEALQECSRKVVTVVTYDAHNKKIAQGKGVIISSDGLVLTNYHLLCPANSAKVFLNKGKIHKKVDWEKVFYSGYEGKEKESVQKKKPKGKKVEVKEISAVDKKLDLILFKIKGKGYSPAKLAQKENFKIGDRALIVVEEDAITEGSITSIHNFQAAKKILQLNLPFPPQLSGSPVFNSKGEVIGITSYVAEKSNLIIPAVYVSSLLQKLNSIPLSKLEDHNYFETSEGLYFKATALAILENYEKALTSVNKSIQLNSQNAFSHSLRGRLCTNLRDYQSAIQAYTQTLNLNPNNYKAAFGLGQAYMRLGQPQKAVTSLVQCTQIKPDFPDAYYNLGLCYQNTEQWAKAAKAYQQFIEINPGPAWTGLNQLGTVYIKMGQYHKAIKVFKKVIQNNPRDIKANYNLAHAYDMSGQYDKAAPFYLQLIELNPKDTPTYYNLLFRLYNKAEQWDRAIKIGEEIITLTPDDPHHHYNLAMIYYKKEDFPSALQSLQKTITLNPEFARAYYNIGLIHFKQEKYEKALEAFTKFTSFKPNNPDAYYNIGAAYLKLKKYEKALSPLQKAVQLKPDYAVAHYNLGIAYYVLKDQFSANQEYEKLTSLDPQLAQKLKKIIHK